MSSGEGWWRLRGPSVAWWLTLDLLGQRWVTIEVTNGAHGDAWALPLIRGMFVHLVFFFYPALQPRHRPSQRQMSPEQVSGRSCAPVVHLTCDNVQLPDVKVPADPSFRDCRRSNDGQTPSSFPFLTSTSVCCLQGSLMLARQMNRMSKKNKESAKSLWSRSLKRKPACLIFNPSACSATWLTSFSSSSVFLSASPQSRLITHQLGNAVLGHAVEVYRLREPNPPYCSSESHRSGIEFVIKDVFPWPQNCAKPNCRNKELVMEAAKLKKKHFK